MLIAGIDPGSELTAYVVLDTRMIVTYHGIDSNERFLSLRAAHPTLVANVLVVERMVSAFVNVKKAGGYIGREVFDGQWWGGIISGQWIGIHFPDYLRAQSLERKQIVTHLCGSAKA